MAQPLNVYAHRSIAAKRAAKSIAGAPETGKFHGRGSPSPTGWKCNTF